MNDLMLYKSMPQWNSQTLPESFTKKHNTKAGTWGKLTIFQGSLTFALMTEEGEITQSLIFTPESETPFVEPQQWHRIVSFSDDLECQLAFYCTREDYFAKKYQLTSTHPDVIDAVKIISPGKVLDLGCGGGRNSLYLALKDFEVTAWDVNENAIEKIKHLSALENISNIHAEVKDLNGVEIKEDYDFILSTVVFMFLNREQIPSLITNMQQHTVVNGYNLIIAAMDTDDYPCTLPFFSFTFKPGELKKYYEGWEFIEYNEDVGSLHKTDEQGNPIKLRFATLLARKIS